MGTLLPPVPLVVSSISLTYQARYVRVAIPRRTMHASCESPCHLSAKHHLLEACLLLMAPFRSMLLTLRGGPQCLAQKARRVPVCPVVVRHSYSKLARRNTNVWNVVRKPSRGMPKAPAQLVRALLSTRSPRPSASCPCRVMPCPSVLEIPHP